MQEIISTDNPYALASDEIDYPFFIYENAELSFWSDNNYIPSYQAVADTFQLKLVSTGSGAYILKKIQINDKKFIVCALLLQRKYPINNDYLSPEWNRRILSSGNVSILEPAASIGTPVCLSGDCLFRISFVSGDFPTHENLKLATIIFFT